MGLSGLDWQTVQLQLSGGLSLKSDPRSDDPPGLDQLHDGEFDDLGGLRTRRPMNAVGTGIIGGGSLTNIRRLAKNGEEMICFTDTGLYSYIQTQDAWSLRSTYLATKVDQSIRFATTGDQTFADRAQIGDVVVYVWLERGGFPYFAAFDAVTEAVILTPTAWTVGGFSFTADLIRIVPMLTKLALFCNFGGSFRIEILDPANLQTSITNILASSTTFGPANPVTGGSLDACAIPGVDKAGFAFTQSPNTSYFCGTVDGTRTVASATKARTCDSSIAIAASPDGLHLQIVRGNGTNVQGDELLVSTLADVFTATAIGTIGSGGLIQLTACYRSVQVSSHWRCFVFWDHREDVGNPAFINTFSVQTNWVDDTNGHGAQTTLVADLGIVSRAFDYNGNVFVNLVFAGLTSVQTPSGLFSSQNQNTYYLFRDDGFQVTKSIPLVAGGFVQQIVGGVTTTRRVLPVVAAASLSNAYAWAGLQRREIPRGELTTSPALNTGYSYRNPCDVTITFDSNEARRCVRLGRTLYISGGEVMQYDGTNLVELGFSTTPWVLLGGMSGAGGNLSAGVYAYKGSYRWDNAQGERDRSSSAAAFSFTATVTNTFTSSWDHPPMRATRKSVLPGGVVMETWRTIVNPTEESNFYLVTSQDPTATTNPNRFVPMVTTTTLTGNAQLTDTLGDATLATLELHPENGDVLENLAPPGGSIMAVSDTRVFIAGVPGDRDRVWYSKQKQDGLVVAFNDALTITIPQPGGDAITALAIQRGALIVFRQAATYLLLGVGLDNTGNGQNYGPAEAVSYDTGAISQEGVVVGPFGTLFQSTKGWYVLTEQHTLKYVGADVAKYDSETILSTSLVELQHQVRIHTSSRMLVWDYLVNKWGEWTQPGIVTAIHGPDSVGDYVAATSAAVSIGSSVYGTTGYGLDFETAWIKPAQLMMGASRTRMFELLGEWRSTHKVRIRTAYDYEADNAGGWLYRDDVVFTPANTVAGTAEQFKRGLSRQQCEALKIRVSVVGSVTLATRATNTLTNGPVVTQQAIWAATLRSKIQGVEGNVTNLTLYACVGSGIEVRDHYTFNGSTWTFAPYCVGIRVGTDNQSVTALEAAIRRYSRLIEVAVPDNQGQASVAFLQNTSTVYSGFFTGGATTQATGEGAKWSALALEVGMRRGLARRGLSSSQKG